MGLRVYPRACGGTPRSGLAPARHTGLSPRVRGNQPVRIAIRVMDGSIPARAGEPRGQRRVAVLDMVYPRACGGTRRTHGRGQQQVGLSPRVRGNRRQAFAGDPSGGSIPARAGEPLRRITNHAQQRVYPRACGGTGISRLVVLPTMGLSPRVRGNPVSSTGSPAASGSIPARAGEPVWIRAGW